MGIFNNLVNKIKDVMFGEPKQPTECHCPVCKLELISNECFMEDNGDEVVYMCNRCGTVSIWRIIGTTATLIDRYFK